MSDYDTLGGAEGVRHLVESYVARFADDFIIGFLFRNSDLPVLIDRETQLACQHLGGPQRYRGHLGKSHQPLRINKGHFRRRLAILRTVLREESVPEDVIDRWIEFERKLEPLISDGTDCVG